MLDFKKLGEVETVDEILDGDTLLVARDGEIYRVDAASAGGGVGGYLLEPQESEISLDSDNGQIIITTKVDDMVAAYKAGAHVVIHFPAAFVNTMLGVELPVVSTLISFYEMDSQRAGMLHFIEGIVAVLFTNGGE